MPARLVEGAGPVTPRSGVDTADTAAALPETRFTCEERRIAALLDGLTPVVGPAEEAALRRATHRGRSRD